MTIGDGIAVFGIWLAVGLTGWKYGGVAALVSIPAMLATMAVAGV